MRLRRGLTAEASGPVLTILRMGRMRSAGCCVLGIAAAWMATAPTTWANPADPAPLPPAHATTTQPVPGDLAPTPSVVSHLTGPQDLPLSDDDPPLGPLGPGMSYLRLLWDAYQAHDISANDALQFLTETQTGSTNPNAEPVLPPGIQPAGAAGS